MISKKGMSALFRLVVVFSVILIIIGSLVVLIIRLGKQSVDVLDVDSLGLLLMLPAARIKQVFCKFL